jgi:hypothetical protein
VEDGRLRVVHEKVAVVISVNVCFFLFLRRRAEQGNSFTLVAAIDAEVIFIDGNQSVPRIEFAHSDQAEISQVGTAVSVASGQIAQMFELMR